MGKIKRFVVFSLHDQRFALHLSAVERVVRIVEINPLPKAPEYIKGIIIFQGRFIPVLDIRKLFNLPEKEIDLNDQLIIANTSMRSVALWVDSASEVIEKTAEEVVSAEKVFFGIDYVEGIFKFEDGMVLLNDLDQFLTLEEISLLKAAMKKQREKAVETAKKEKEAKDAGKKEPGASETEKKEEPETKARPSPPKTAHKQAKAKKTSKAAKSED